MSIGWLSIGRLRWLGLCLVLVLWADLAAAQEAHRLAPPSASRDTPRIGLVLSGGGAKGFAHIGVLKTLEGLDVPVDVVTGTSMGAVLGGLYGVWRSGRRRRIACRAVRAVLELIYPSASNL